MDTSGAGTFFQQEEGAENIKYISFVLPKNGQSFASTSDFNKSRALRILKRFNLNRWGEAPNRRR